MNDWLIAAAPWFWLWVRMLLAFGLLLAIAGVGEWFMAGGMRRRQRRREALSRYCNSIEAQAGGVR